MQAKILSERPIYTQINEDQAFLALTEEGAIETLSKIESIIRKNSLYTSYLNPSVTTSNSYEDLRIIARKINDRFAHTVNAREKGWLESFFSAKKSIRELYTKIEEYFHPKFFSLSPELIGKISSYLSYSCLRGFVRINKEMHQISKTAYEFRDYRFSLSYYNKLYVDLLHFEQAEIIDHTFFNKDGKCDFKEVVNLSPEKIFKIFANKKVYSTPYTRFVQLLTEQAMEHSSANLDDKTAKQALIEAFKHGAESVIELLILKGINPNMKLELTNNNISFLQFCIGAGLTRNLELLLKFGAEIDALDSNGLQPLFSACRQGNVEAVKTLLAWGADPLFIAENGSQALHHAAQTGHVEIVRLLLEQGAPINAYGQGGKTPLIWSLENKDTSVFKLLLDCKADMALEDEKGRQPLHYAASSCNKMAIELLVAHGADVHRCDSKGRNIIAFACASKQDDVYFVRYLIELGVDPDLADKFGLTPFVYAARGGEVEILKLLIQHGIDLKKLHSSHIRAQDWIGKTQSQGIQIIELFLKLGLDPCSATDESGNSPLHFAAARGYWQIIEMLLKFNLSIDQLNTAGVSPLMWACCHPRNPSESIENEITVKLLLERGADVHSKDEDGNQAMHYAVKHGLVGVMQLLLKAGADVNALNYKGSTPLSFAFENKHYYKDVKDVTKILLQHGAELNIANSDGLRPLDIAILHGCTSSVAQLQEWEQQNLDPSSCKIKFF